MVRGRGPVKDYLRHATVSRGTRALSGDAFHVERHQSGRLAGTPTRRGNRSEASAVCSSTRTGPARPRSARPSSPNGPAGQRSSVSPGGSLTTSRPATRRKPQAHSAVTAGEPKLRLTTRSNAPRNAGNRAARSARSVTTVTRSARSSSPTADSRNAVRRVLASRNTHRLSSHRTARTRPGRPPPLPRSRASIGDATARAKPSACSKCWTTGPGPRKPSPRARSSTVVRGWFRLRLRLRKRVRERPRPCQRRAG